MTCDCRSSNYSCSNAVLLPLVQLLKVASTHRLYQLPWYVFQLLSEFRPLHCYTSLLFLPMQLRIKVLYLNHNVVWTGLIITGIAVTTATTVFWYLMHSQQRLLPHKSSSSIYNRVTKVLPVPNTTPVGLLYQLIPPLAIDWSVVDPSTNAIPRTASNINHCNLVLRFEVVFSR
jgi:hypothetical protein